MELITFKADEPIPMKSQHCFIWKYAAVIAAVTYHLLTCGTSLAEQGEPGTTLPKPEIEQLLDAPQSDQRQIAANSILKEMGLDTTWALETILRGIKIEQDYLTRSTEINQTYVWASWYIIQRYVRDLASLGLHSPALLNEIGDKMPIGQRDWIIIARGYQQDETVRNKLRGIITDTGNPAQKAMAVEAISNFRDTSDISILVDEGLADDNTIIWAGKSDLRGLNPVAPACREALRELGYVLEWDSTEFKFNLKKLDVSRDISPK